MRLLPNKTRCSEPRDRGLVAIRTRWAGSLSWVVSRQHMPEGVQYPDIIDKVIREKDGSVALVMREDRPWDGSDGRLAELQKKINTYAAYARQGQLATDFPDLADKPVFLQL